MILFICRLILRQVLMLINFSVLFLISLHHLRMNLKDILFTRPFGFFFPPRTNAMWDMHSLT
jgi:hypothetical protein